MSTSNTERLLVVGVAVLGLLALAAVVAVGWNLLGSPGAPGSPPPSIDPSSTQPAVQAPPPDPAPAPRPAPVERPKRERRATTTRRDVEESTEGTGSVIGRVVDSTARPVAGVSLELRRGRNFFGDESEARGGRHEATTAADGTFRLSNVSPAENYVIVARKAGSAGARQRGIQVHSGEETKIPDLTLTRGGTITGTVTDRNGAPIREARVVADNSPFAGLDIWTAKGDFATTDVDGHYRIEHLLAGKTKVIAGAKGFAPGTQIDVDVVDERDTGEINFMLDPALTISGIVTDTAGQALEGVKVYATATDFRDVSRSQVLTDASGKYVLDGLSTGTFYVFVDKDGYTRPDKRTVKAGAEDVNFQLEPNGTISGKVVDRTSGSPIPKFVIRYGRSRDATVLGLGFRAESDDPSGEFSVTDLDAGFYVLEVVAEGYAPKRTEPIELKSQGHVEGVLVLLDHGSTIRGTVRRSPDRAAIAGVVVTPRRARNEGGTIIAEIGGRPARERAAATTDASGGFTITNVGAGAYILELSHPEYAPGKLEGVEVLEGAPVDVGDVLVYRGGAVTGIVHDKNGAADANAQVSIGGAGFEKKVRTNAEGRFEIRGIPPGDYTISVLVRGGQVDFEGLLQADDGGQRITVNDGQTLNVNL